MITPEEFERRWLARLTSGADVLFRCGELPEDAFTHAAIADAYVKTLGLKPIGFNWELLDSQAGWDEPRSALGEITKAVSTDLAKPGKNWLKPETARQCAIDFLDLFATQDCTVVSNRYDGLWNPIAGKDIEWGFVGFSDHRIALFLLAAK